MNDRTPTPVDPLYVQIGYQIRLRREHLDVTQLELAKAIGMSRPFIVNVEQGKQSITVLKLVKIAQALSVPFEDLVAGPLPGYVEPIPANQLRLRTLLEIAHGELGKVIAELQ